MGRLRFLGWCFALLFVAITLRLAQVTLLPETVKPIYETRMDGLQIKRRDIVDRNGEMLATSLQTVSLYAHPKQMENPAATAQALAKIFPELSYGNLLKVLSSERPFIWIKRHITPGQHYAVNALGDPALDFQEGYRRIYLHGALTSHVLGFENIDNKGMAGLAQALNTELSQKTDEPIQLAMDVRLQYMLAEELQKAMQTFSAKAAAGGILSLKDRELVAMVSLPSFDPNEPGQASPDARFNRMSLGAFELGSVFKAITVASALETKAIKLSDGFDATHPIRVGRHTIHDFHPEARWLTVPEIFMVSSNIGTVKIAQRMSPETQQSFLKRLGLLEQIDMELPERARPLVPQRWGEIQRVTVSFGHGIAVTPLHLMQAVATLVHDGQVRPMSLLAQEYKPGEQVFSQETVTIMRQLMRDVVAEGTATKADVPGYQVGGKTGTAEKVVNGRYDTSKLISSFIGAFPMSDPQYLLFVMLDEPKGTKETYGYATAGWTAAPITAAIIRRMAVVLGMPPVEDPAAEEEAEHASE